MGQAKLRKAEIQQLKNPKPLFESANGDIKVYKVGSLDKFKELTGLLPYEFESLEYTGLKLADLVLNGDFSDMKSSAEKELYIGSWKDMIVEVNNRKSKGSKEYFAVRLGKDDVVVSRPAYRDTLTLSGIEAAFTRFAMSANHIGWYAHHRGPVRLGMFNEINAETAFEYYHMAMFAAAELNLDVVYRVLN